MTFNELQKEKIIAVIRGGSEYEILSVVKSLLDGGIKAIELTMDTPEASNLIKIIKDKFLSDVIIGAGTVMSIEDAKVAINSGSQFLVSPHLDIEIIEYTKKNDCLSVPGSFSPTEVISAYRAGADIVKVFPANSVGPNFIKDIKGPFPHIPLMPTGGINLTNIDDFIKSGANVVGVGGSLVNKELISNKQYDQITDLAKLYIKNIKEC